MVLEGEPLFPDMKYKEDAMPAQFQMDLNVPETPIGGCVENIQSNHYPTSAAEMVTRYVTKNTRYQ